jgi:SAM-dependent methyltransferase
MVRQARALVTEANVQFEVGDGHTLPSLADGSADLVLSFTVFQHISDPAVIEGYMAEVGRVLRPGGAFAFQWDGRRDSLRWRVGRRARIWLQHSGILPERRRRHDPAFFGSRLPVTWVEAALGRSGLRVLHIEGAGSLWAFAWAQRQ